MKGRAKFLGHAMHPMMVMIPIGALPVALVFNLLYVVTGDAAWFPAAFVTTLLGTVVLLAAIIPGYVDYRSVVPRRGEVYRHARLHLYVGLSLAVLYVVSTLVHWAGYPTPGTTVAWAALALNALGGLGLGVQGYLGGGLVEDHQIGVETDTIREEAADEEKFPVGRDARGARGDRARTE